MTAEIIDRSQIKAAINPERDTVLLLDGVNIRNGMTGEDVVRGISFRLRKGQVVGIVGESGSGKTLTCRSILGILPQLFTVSKGSISLLGHDVLVLDQKQWTQLRGTSITAVFQDPGSYLNPSIKVGAQIAEVLRTKRGVSRHEAEQQTLRLLEDVRLRDPELVYGQYPFELSGGMLQRVLIAAAISLGPQILIADEVTTALDVTVQAEILDLLVDLKERHGLSLIVVSHDLAVVAQVCDEVLVLRDGEVVEKGSTAEVLRRPKHEYTRLLVGEHQLYGLERFLGAKPTTAKPKLVDSRPVLIRAEGICVSYDTKRSRRQALRDATFSLREGESVGVIGETGSGKSTLARALIGLVAPSKGQISIAGEEITGFNAARWRDFRRRGIIQYVFQDPLRSLDPEVTIAETLAEPLQLRGGLSRTEIQERIAFRLEQVRLKPDLLDRFPGELSGGQRQRIAVARALVTEPKVLILDEPVSALDSANRVQVLEILNSLRASGTSLMFISHDLGSVAGVTDRVIVLYRGSIVESAATDDVVNRPSHLYTRLLVGSAPTVTSTGLIDRHSRQELREELEAAS
ncbi:MAG: ABC transporter ATP-binding protein [Rhizobiaceae bacterium]|nr:ABC transporter ATP-binding protein [Rhizobiaceae bacterium]